MNQHIKEYLDYYINMSNPQYAVMLTGDWGSGKTYFIKKLIKEWEFIDDEETDDDILIQPIYVSLNGISDIRAVNERIRAVISPFLHSKGVKLLKKVGKGLLKMATKIDVDFDGDDKGDGSVTFSLDSLGLFESEHDNVKGRKLLVFDDVERCKIGTDEIFGYINHFVEHSTCKVIILADEDKINKKYENCQEGIIYKDFKEKLIGQTFKLQVDIDAIIPYFIEEANLGFECRPLKHNQQIIKELIISSGLNNLRVIRQAFGDFIRLEQMIAKDFGQRDKYEDFAKNFLAYFILVYAEFKTGNDQIVNFQGPTGYGYENTKDKMAEKYNPFLEKFGCIHSSHIVQISGIVEYIRSGVTHYDQLKQFLATSHFFRTETQVDWERLWYWWEMEDDEFADVSKRVWKQFLAGDIQETTVLLHIAGTFLMLISDDVLKVQKDVVLKQSKKILKRIFKKNTSYVTNHVVYGLVNSSWGKQYHSLNTAEFQDLQTYLDNLVKATQTKIASDYLKEVFGTLSDENVAALSEKMRASLPDHSTTYERTAILHTINARSLAKRIKLLSNKSVFIFRTFIHSHYNPQETYSNLKLESYHKHDMATLKELKIELEKILKSAKILKKRGLILLVEDIDKTLLELKKI